MRWPRATAPAWPVHAGFAGTMLVFGIGYAVAGPGARALIFAAVTTVPVLTLCAALLTRHLTDRRPWITALAGMILLAVSMAHSPGWITDHHLGRAEGRPVDFVIATAHSLFLIGTAWALRRHGRDDSGGMLDAALLGLCAAGPLWAWLIAPHLTDRATLPGEMLALADLMVLCGVLSCLVRIGVRSRPAREPIAYLLACVTLTLAGEVCAVLTVHGTATWTIELMIAGYLSIGVAVLLPAAPQITFPSRRARPGTGEPPLAWIGAALSANPVMAAVQAFRGDQRMSLLLPIGSVLIVPLVLLRLRQLAAQRRRAERTLAHHAHHDELTGLVNRRHITARIDEALAGLRTGALDQVTVLLCDLDGFKPVNDRFGHQAGDAVLRTVAARLTGAVDPADVVGRIGGDEFLILLRCTGASPGAVAGRLAALVSEPIPIGPAEVVRVGVSIGVATATHGTDLDRDTFIGLADTEMYTVKADRRRQPAMDPALG